MVYIVDRTVWPLSLPIRTTLANVVLITTLLHPFLTQTACGLCAHSSSSRVLCAPPTQSEVATTSMPKTFLSTWSSSVPLRIFSCEQLELWSQMELESCMNRRLSPLSMLAGWKTFLGGCHCFLAFLMATQHQLFHTSTLDDKSRPSNSGVLTAKALHHAGAAMYMRSTTGCGTLADPSPELEDFQCPKLKGSAESPGPRHPGALGRPGRPARWLQMRYDKYMPGICLAYTCQIFMLRKKTI